MGATKTKRPRKRAAVRLGRPPREQAGEVEERLLEAARSVFLEHGYGGASIDEIARIARASKPTIYARYPTKEALFAGVVERKAAHVAGRFDVYIPQGETLEEKLVQTASHVLSRLLDDHVIELMRMASAESRRFPNLTSIGRRSREGGTRAIEMVLAEVAKSGDAAAYPGLARERLAETTGFFVDLVVGRLLMRAIFGEDLKELRTEASEQLQRSVRFFLAACSAGKAD